MRKLVLALAAIASLGVVLPAVSSQASAETVIIKHRGHHHDWHPHHARKVVVIRHRH